MTDPNAVSVLPVQLNNKPENFIAGKISNNYENWKKITSDKFLLDIVANGYKLEFESHPCLLCTQKPIKFNKHEKSVITELLEKLQNKGIIKRVKHEFGEVISNIFIRPKHDGSHRLILNLSKLNDHIEKIHFKMETLKSALNFIKKGTYFAKIDLKDAYYSVPIHETDRKFMRFEWEGHLYEYTCLANGLTSAPRIFTKLLKLMYSSLRKIGHTNVGYIDDSLLAGDTKSDCQENVNDTVTLVDSLGFTLHPEKSIMVPTQRIEFVGFWLDSVKMTVSLGIRKANDIKAHIATILPQSTITIRAFSKLIGKLVASEPAVKFAPLYYKTLEIDRDNALKNSRGNFDARMPVSNVARDCLNWWVNNIDTAYRPILLGPPHRKIETDSSMTGYGGHDVTNGTDFNGHWTDNEQRYHINYLELKAAFLCLQVFCAKSTGEHVHLFLDNTTAIKYISKMGGRKPLLNSLARDIWIWCEKRNIWLSVFHIPGKLNVKADGLSRISKKLNSDMEWALDMHCFQEIERKMGKCTIDLFASSCNHKLERYVSFIPDDKACAVNAFSISWSNEINYLFPPFSVLGRCLQKIVEDRAEGIVVCPIFTTQTFFPQLLHLISGQCYILPKVDKLLQLPGKQQTHPLTSMKMGVFRVSGNTSRVREYQKTLPKLSSLPGEIQLRNNIGHISKNGCSFVVKDKLLTLSHL